MNGKTMLRLTIENHINLPDGGPTSITVSGRRGIDIGRDASLDWTLPDPSRFISSKHCEIRYEDGGFVLHDLSLNGTFLNDAQNRIQGPHRLRDGDRLTIGDYIIAVKIDPSDEGAADVSAVTESTKASVPRASAYPDTWEAPEPPPPIDPRELRPAQRRSQPSDFLDWSMDVFDPLGPPSTAHDAIPSGQVDGDVSWLPPLPAPPPEPAAPPLPEPQRPVWDSTEPSDLYMRGAPSGQPLPGQSPPSSTPSPAPPESSVAVTTPAQPEGPAATGVRFASRFAEAAGLPADAIAKQDPEEFGRHLGALFRIVVEGLIQLLHARLAAKRIAGSRSQTMIEAFGNNPLKFSPTPTDALRLLFGPPMRGYLEPGRALQQTFTDLKQHEIDVLAAMQGAVKMLVEDLDPDAIEQMVGNDRGLFAKIGSPKAKLWDAYVARWKAKAHRHDNGLLGAFMLYFSHCYDQAAARTGDNGERSQGK
ncbi:MAG TPA: type VI secretion system-associated FHA domain protein TagH [Methylocella sp.]|nr:type VI secretion system-associated FHA domain protein TagH [Methylocella sp.]